MPTPQLTLNYQRPPSPALDPLAWTALILATVIFIPALILVIYMAIRVSRPPSSAGLAFAVGTIALLLCLTGLTTIILALISVVRIARSKRRLRGYWPAILALLLGLAQPLLGILLFLFSMLFIGGP